MNVTFRQLRVFAAVARHGSMTRAADELHLTTPAVSMQVRELESQVGVPLFDRVGRHVVLSTAGEYFLVHARRMLAALKDADDAMARLRHLDAGTLRIGLVGTAKYFVPRLLALFREEHPSVQVGLEVAGNREALVTLLRAGEVDLAVMGRPPRELAVRSEAFAAHPLVFVAPPGHPLAALREVTPMQLDAWPFIVREQGSGTRAAMQEFFATHGCAPLQTMAMSSNETIKQAVMAGLGLSFLSLHTLGIELGAGLLRVLPVQGAPLLRTWNVVQLQARRLSPAAEAFRALLLERGESFLAEQDRQALADASPP
jgi:DNA-binding transcriptional LysR family regulator